MISDSSQRGADEEMKASSKAEDDARPVWRPTTGKGSASNFRTIACKSLLVLAGIAIGAPVQSSDTNSAPSAFVTLGTAGGPVATANRSQPANMLRSGQDYYLVDAGDGAVGQLAKLGIPLQKIKAVFLSHLHFDHIGGLGAVIGLRFQIGAPGKLKIFGPPGTKALVDGIVASMIPAAGAGLGFPGGPVVAPADTVEVVELTDGQHADIGDLTVVVAQNCHFSFVAGSEEDRKFKSLALRFNLPKRTIMYTGDTGPCPAVEKLATGADLLVSEVIDRAANEAEIRKNFTRADPALIDLVIRHNVAHHMSPTEVGQLATRAKVSSVVLTHLAPPAASDQELAMIKDQVRSVYSGPVFIASDLQAF